MVVPIDAQLHVQQVVYAVWTLNHLHRAFHAASRKKERVHRAQCRLRRAEALALRKLFGAEDSERGVGACRYSNIVGNLRFAQTQQPPRGGVMGEGELGSVV